MISTKKGSLAAGGIMVAWLTVVVLSVQGIEAAADFWRSRCKALVQAEVQVRRMKGWVAVGDKVRARRDEALGPFAHLSESEISWAHFQGFQQAAAAIGLSVGEIKPVETPGKKGSGPILRLDAKVEGSLEQVSALLEKLPDVMPGVMLENLQIMPRGGTGIQCLIRLRLFSS